MRTNARLPFLLAIVLCTPACFPALLGVGAGVVISHEILENNTYVAQVSEEAALTWAITRASLSRQSDDPITVDDDLRTATGNIGGSTVTACVETFNDESCRVMVSASRHGFSHGPSAEAALNQILAEINEASL
jgi:hypothetical protein